MSMHSFDTEDAARYGILSAVILHNIRFWTEKNRANRRHLYEGKTWVYNSVSAWSELFPYATRDQIRRALEKLRDDGVIEIGNFNQSAYDRTAWYCLSCQIEMAELPNGSGENAEPIPVGNPVGNPNNLCNSASPNRAEKKSKVPFTDIMQAYRDSLPELPQPQLMTATRKRSMATCWDMVVGTKSPSGQTRFTDTETGIKWWGSIFRKVRLNSHWMGQNDRGWSADFDWLTNPKNFVKVLEWKPAEKAE